MNTVEKGRIAAAKVTMALVEQGWEVYVPAFDNGMCDLVALRPAGCIRRIEVKYASRIIASGSVEISLRQTRHNMTSITTKHFDSGNADVLASYLAPFDCVAFFDTSELHKRASLTVSKISANDHVYLDGQSDDGLTELVLKTNER